MRTTAVLSLFAAAVSAAIPADAQFYTLQTKSAVNSINNLYLSVKNGKVGAFAGVRDSASGAGKFFTQLYAPTGTFSLQSSDDTHQTALQLANKGFLQLVDLVSPTAESIGGKPTEWSVFTIGPDGTVGVKDGADIPSRQWAAYLDTDGNYYVGLWDGFTRQPRSLANITIVASRTSSPAKAKRTFLA